MKKKIFLILTLVMVVMISLGTSSFAQNTKGVGNTRNAVPSKTVVRAPMTQLRAPLFLPMWEIYQAIKEKTVTPTADGGIVVVLGNQMIKYDKDLNIVREAEIKIDLNKMRESMMTMMSKNAMPNRGMASNTSGFRPDLKK